MPIHRRLLLSTLSLWGLLFAASAAANPCTNAIAAPTSPQEWANTASLLISCFGKEPPPLTVLKVARASTEIPIPAIATATLLHAIRQNLPDPSDGSWVSALTESQSSLGWVDMPSGWTFWVSRNLRNWEFRRLALIIAMWGILFSFVARNRNYRIGLRFVGLVGIFAFGFLETMAGTELPYQVCVLDKKVSDASVPVYSTADVADVVPRRQLPQGTLVRTGTRFGDRIWITEPLLGWVSTQDLASSPSELSVATGTLPN